MHIHTYINIWIETHDIHTYKNTHTHTQQNTQTNMYTSTHAYSYIYLFTHTQASTNINIKMYTEHRTKPHSIYQITVMHGILTSYLELYVLRFLLLSIKCSCKNQTFECLCTQIYIRL